MLIIIVSSAVVYMAGGIGYNVYRQKHGETVETVIPHKEMWNSLWDLEKVSSSAVVMTTGWREVCLQQDIQAWC